MHIVSRDIGAVKEFTVVGLGDIQYGHPNCDVKVLKDAIDFCVETRALIVGTGDYLDFTSPSQRAILKALRDSQSSAIAEMQEDLLNDLINILKPTTGQWLGLVEGHHFFVDEAGISTDQKIAKALGAPFCGTTMMAGVSLTYQHTERRIAVFAQHGIGTARTSGGNLHRVEDMTKTFNAHILLMGHAPTQILSTGVRCSFASNRGDKIIEEPYVMARTGGFVRGYAPQKQKANHTALQARGQYEEARAYVPKTVGWFSCKVEMTRSGSPPRLVRVNLHSTVHAH